MSTATDISFDLYTENWIPITDNGRDVVYIGLKDAWSQDYENHDLALNGMERIAVNRLLASLSARGDREASAQSTGSVSDNGFLNLFGDKPFMQDPDLAQYQDDLQLPIRYLDQTGMVNSTLTTGPQLPSLIQGMPGLSFADAAILLLREQHFAVSRRLRGKMDDSKYLLRGKNSPSGGRMIVHPRTGSFQRDALILGGYIENTGIRFPNDRPSYTWGEDHRTPSRKPLGPLDVFTWHTRRTLLISSEDGSSVNGVIFTQGVEMDLNKNDEDAQRFVIDVPMVPKNKSGTEYKMISAFPGEGPRLKLEKSIDKIEDPVSSYFWTEHDSTDDLIAVGAHVENYRVANVLEYEFTRNLKGDHNYREGLEGELDRRVNEPFKQLVKQRRGGMDSAQFLGTDKEGARDTVIRSRRQLIRDNV